MSIFTFFFNWLKRRKKAKKKNARATHAPKSRSLMLALEPRYLYDAAGLAVGLDILSTADGHDYAADAELDSAPKPDTSEPPDFYAEHDGLNDPEPNPDVQGFEDLGRFLVPFSEDQPDEIVFIDPAVKNYGTLIQGISLDARVIVLDPTRDGMVQANEFLSQYANIRTLHILSHGSPGQLSLGHAELGADTIEGYAPLLTQWKNSLAQDADILIYGCDVGATPQGTAFLSRLAELTGADVAGSDDATGSAENGGDWDLETRIGDIEAGSAVSLPAQDAYDNLLNQPPELDNTGDAALTDIHEDTPQTDITGDTVESLIHSMASDPDGDPLGIAVTHLDDENGTWQYSTDDGSHWNAFGILSDTSAVLLGPADKIRFVPDTDFNGIAAITFRAWDQTHGTQGDAHTNLSELQPDPTSISIQADDITALVAGDIDGDGNLDVISVSESDDKIVWYGNPHGTGKLGSPTLINTETEGGGKSAFAADMDGDGDTDVLSALTFDDKVVWYENISGDGVFVKNQTISIEADGASSVVAADIDGDNDMDVIVASWNDDTVSWYENTDGVGTFGPRNIVTTEADGASSVFVADIDSDNDMDMLSASAWDDTIAWYENTDGHGHFGPRQVITTDADWALSVFATDMDGDGDPDVLSASQNDNKIAWYENTGGVFGPQQVITVNADGANAVFAADMDGDDAPDVLSASMNDNTIAWYGNVDGKGAFDGSRNIITINADGANAVFAADIDGDNDPDVLSASQHDGRIAWYENTDGIFGSQNIITTFDNGANFVFAADMDSDGDMDVLSASENDDRIPWYENTDGEGTFGPAVTINLTAEGGASSVFVADLDGDDDKDILAGFAFDDMILWYENIDSAGTFVENQTISVDADGVRSVFAADLDNDGDLDVLSASWNDDQVVWYENTNGSGRFEERQVLTDHADGASAVFAADLDNDGDTDVISGSAWDDKIAWYENTDSAGTFEERQIISTDADWAVSVSVADIDGDGDPDILSGSENDGKIAWYENTDAMGTFGPQRVISISARGVGSVVATDMDGDGDADVVSASGWYENNGHGTFGPENIINETADSGSVMLLADLDGDNDPDLLLPSGDEDIVLYENVNAYSSDSEIAVLTVLAVNDPPTPGNDEAFTDEDHAVTIVAETLLSNDVDIENDVLTITSFTPPSHGNLADNGDGTLTYTPDPDFNGADTFSYTISDNSGATGDAAVNITVNAVNDVPVANDDAVSAYEDTLLIITVNDILDNDTDADNDVLTFEAFTQPSHGTLRDNGDGTLTFAPEENFAGPDRFTYTISDGSGETRTASVSLTINGICDDPVAEDDRFSTDEDAVRTISVQDILGNDTDDDGDTLIMTAFTHPSHGYLTDNNDGTLTYIPLPDFNGVDRFSYTASDETCGTDIAFVNIIVNPVEDMPDANDDNLSTDEDRVLTLSVKDMLSNDTDADGNSLTLTAFTQPAHGSLTDNGDGTLAYHPTPDFNGADNFAYTIDDGNGNTDTATVNITVNPVNDMPVADDDSVSTTEDTLLTISADLLLTNDTDVDEDVLSITDVTRPAHGTLVEKDDGSFSYIPETDFMGSDRFVYTLSDGKGGTDTATVHIRVEEQDNMPPLAADDSLLTDEDVSLTISGSDMLNNDTDADGDSLTLTAFTQPAHGSLTDNGDGTLTYHPTADFNGADSFAYTIDDGNGGTDAAEVNITVNAVNDAPVANDDDVSADEDAALSIAAGELLENDTDVDGNTLIITAFTQPSHGNIVDNGDGRLTYHPTNHFNGSDRFTYTIADGNGVTDTATVNIMVNAVNDFPSAHDDSISADEDTPLTITSEFLLGNDADADGDVLTITHFTQPSRGELFVNEDDALTYVPETDFAGSDRFAYVISDGKGGSDAAMVRITVKPSNTAPVSADDSVFADENMPLVLTAESLLGNDTDADGDVLTITSFTQPSHGEVVDNEDGRLTYTPETGFVGWDRFDYAISDGKGGSDTATVRISVKATAENTAPVSGDDHFSVAQDTRLVITADSLLGNDTDADRDALSIISFTQPSHGSIVQDKDDGFIYTPESDFSGMDQFTYTISDGNAGTDTAAVNITVTAGNAVPIAHADTIVTDEDIAVTVSAADFLDNDVDPDGHGLGIERFDQPVHGTFVDNKDGTFTYMPDTDFNGMDSFEYVISDADSDLDTAMITITVNAVNDAPVASDDHIFTDEDMILVLTSDMLLTNDADAEGDILHIMEFSQPFHGHLSDHGEGTLTYVPVPDFNGTDSFDYAVSDENGGVDTGTVMIMVNSINDMPIANDDDMSTPEDIALKIFPENLLGNDTDAEGASLVITNMTQPSHGELGENDDGTFTYLPNPDFSGSDHFAYTISDDHSGADTALVNIVVNAVNDMPVANDDGVLTYEDTWLSITVADILGNDTDADQDVLTMTDFSQPSHGYLMDNGDGTLTYMPEPDFNGPDGFHYTLSDSAGGTDTAMVHISVNAVGESPIANDDTMRTYEDVPLIIPVETLLSNDMDADGDILFLTDFSPPDNGALTDNGDGTLAYTPQPDFNGSDSFAYAISDGNGGIGTAIVHITVNAVNDMPIANDDTALTDEDVPLTIAPANLLSNDTDADGDVLGFADFTQPSHGSLVDNGDGTLTYTPNDAFSGPDSFTYTISDAMGGTDTAAVHITVSPVADENHAPSAKDDEVSVDEDARLSIAAEHLLRNDTDIDGDDLVITDMTRPSHGNVADHGDGTFTFIPEPDFHGMDQFSYTISDSNGGADTARVHIIVNPVNDWPDASDDRIVAIQGISLDIVAETLLVNDVDVDKDVLVISGFTQPAHGELVDHGDGTWTYAPAADHVGPDSFAYIVSDGNGGTDSASVRVTVEPGVVDDVLVVNDDTAVTDQDRVVTFSPLLNDSSTRGDMLSIVSFTEPAHGSVTDNGDGTFTYAPDYGFFGESDRFVYKATDGEEDGFGVVDITVRETFGNLSHIPIIQKTLTEDVSDDESVESVLIRPYETDRVRMAITCQIAKLDENYGGGEQYEIIRYQAVTKAREMGEEGIDPGNMGLDGEGNTI